MCAFFGYHTGWWVSWYDYATDSTEEANEKKEPIFTGVYLCVSACTYLHVSLSAHACNFVC